jgi:hypothetical protein
VFLQQLLRLRQPGAQRRCRQPFDRRLPSCRGSLPE